MKAVILAAGKGERLKEITSQIPKPMIEYKGKPILQHNIELCKKFGIDEIFINTHHLHEIIQNYFSDGKKFGVKISYSVESSLLGTSGAVKSFKSQLGSNPFFVIYGDNYSEYDLNLLSDMNEQKHCLAVIGFHYREETSQSGIAEFADDGRITRFIEKPKSGESNSRWVNAGVYYLQPEIFKYIPEGFSDFAKDIFPHLLELEIPIYGVCSDAKVTAFDTPEMFQQSINSK